LATEKALEAGAGLFVGIAGMGGILSRRWPPQTINSRLTARKYSALIRLLEMLASMFTKSVVAFGLLLTERF
jgi:hypothetical protein